MLEAFRDLRAGTEFRQVIVGLVIGRPLGGLNGEKASIRMNEG